MKIECIWRDGFRDRFDAGDNPPPALYRYSDDRADRRTERFRIADYNEEAPAFFPARERALFRVRRCKDGVFRYVEER